MSVKYTGLGVGFANEAWSPPPTQSSLPFCAGVQFSRDSNRAFNDLIKIRENRGQ